jgi:poly(A) polymerase
MITQRIKGLVKRLVGGETTTPKRIGRSDHQIDRQHVSRNAIKVCEVLQQHGYQAYIVGGAVRDLIIGLEPKDFDVATNATPEQIQPLFRRARIIGRRFRLVHVVFGREIIETSTFRAPSSGEQLTDDHGRILRDNVFGTHEQDAERRDFTINALYYDPVTEEVIDLHRGVQDLKRRVVRMIGEPAIRYREDPVRMLRAVRFAVKLKGKIDADTEAPIAKHADLINNVPAARLFDEILKLLTCGDAMLCVKQLQAHGLHGGLLPLLDIILQDPEGYAFIELALERTDARIRSGKTVSPSFLFAALLWPQVRLHWQRLHGAGEHVASALIAAADQVLNAQTESLAINRRYASDMREIWFMQPRFDRRVPRSIHRMFEQPRFRAAVEFLQLRAACAEFDSVVAQWWMDLADASESARALMLQELAVEPKGTSDKGRRRRRRKPTNRSSDAATNSDRSSPTSSNANPEP